MGIGEAIIGSSLLGLGGSILGSRESSSAAKSAANTQADAADRSAQAQLDMYYQSREDAAPWRLAGEKALGSYDEYIQKYANVPNQYGEALADPSKYLQSPGYNWLVDQGVQGINRGASATGKLDSGQRSKDLMDWNRGAAAQDYGNYLNQLLNSQNFEMNQVGTTANMYGNLAGLGQNTAISGGQQAMQTGQNVGQSYLAAGDAQAGGTINQANARTGLYSNIAGLGSNAMDQYMMAKMFKLM